MKGQTAMEYLMTYGWAIVVIVIVLAVLAAMFSQSQAVEYCSFNPIGSFTCEGNPAIYTTGSTVEVVLTFRNNYADTVDFSATNAGVSCNGGTQVKPSSPTVAPGETTTVTVDCGNVGTEGQKFDQEIEFRYQLPADKTAGSYRTAKATVRGTIGTK